MIKETCYQYRITNTGTRKFLGTYTKFSTRVEEPFYVPPGLSVTLNDVLGGSITAEDPTYFQSFVSSAIVKTCPPIVPPPPVGCTVVINEVITTPNTSAGLFGNGTATIVINEEMADYEFSIDNEFWQASNVFIRLGGLNSSSGASLQKGYKAYVRKKSDPTCGASLAFTLPASTPILFVSAEVIKSPTQPGASDGEIKATVYSGSGNYTVKVSFDNLVHNLDSGESIQSMIKVGVPAGSYTVTFTDLANGAVKTSEVTVVDPAPVEVDKPGEYAEVPSMNSIHWVREELSEPQTADNRLLVNQYYKGHKKTEYFQPVTKFDFLSTQFYTDYNRFKCQLFKYGTSKVIKTFAEPILLEENIGRKSDFPIRIENDPLFIGRSRVYFTAGPPPVPVFMDTPFEIVNSNEWYNGIYKPVAIETDENLGYPYIVISKDWVQPLGVEQVFATGRFEATTNDFNVYEYIHDLTDVPNDCYYMKLTAFDDNSGIEFISEPIDLRDDHKDTLRLTYTNRDNKFGMAFVHGYTGVVRIPALFGHRGTPGGERTTNRNSDTRLVKVEARKFRRFPLEIYGVPRYVHEKVATLIDCDYWTINGVQHQTDEGYPVPTFIDRSLLSHATVIVEQVGWYDRFKSVRQSGAAGVGGFIATGTGGFISR